MSSTKGAVDPMIASVDKAAVTIQALALSHAVHNPTRAQAVENCVPLIRASPSLGPRMIGAKPASASAAPPGIRTPSYVASPSPIITAAICASGATPERDQFEHHHQPSRRLVQHLANAAAMRQDQVALQGLGLVGRNLDAGQFAKAGVDAVNGRVALGRTPDKVRGGHHLRTHRLVQPRGMALTPDRLELGQADCTGDENLAHAAPSKMRRNSGLNPIR